VGLGHYKRGFEILRKSFLFGWDIAQYQQRNLFLLRNYCLIDRVLIVEDMKSYFLVFNVIIASGFLQSEKL